jgi:hypothetical protein
MSGSIRAPVRDHGHAAAAPTDTLPVSGRFEAGHIFSAVIQAGMVRQGVDAELREQVQAPTAFRSPAGHQSGSHILWRIW